MQYQNKIMFKGQRFHISAWELEQGHDFQPVVKTSDTTLYDDDTDCESLSDNLTSVL